MSTSVATRLNPNVTSTPGLTREEAQKIAEEYLFDHVSSFVLPGEPELAGSCWRFPVLRAYATTEDRPTVGFLTVDAVEGTTAFAKSGT